MRTRPLPRARAALHSARRAAGLRGALSLFFVLGAVGCACDGSGTEADGGASGEADGSATGPGPTVRQVWLAQTHVQPIEGQPELQFAEDALEAHLGRTDLRMVKLVGGRDVLLKVDVTARDGGAAPPLRARVLDGAGVELWSSSLRGPDVLPTSLASAPGEVEHDLANSFVVLIPGEHVRTGIEIGIELGADGAAFSRVYPVEVGAPTILPVLMFDFDYFGTREDRVLSDAVVAEVGLKVPARQMAVQRIDAPFSRATFPPQSQDVDGVRYTAPHLRASSFEDWAQQAEAATGVAWLPRNGRGVDQTHVLLGALQRAGAQAYISALHGNFVDGTRGSFKGRGGSNMLSSSTSADVLNAQNIFVHELSHSLDLYHWHEQTDGDYPYVGEMFGIGAEGANGTHCGPVWRYRHPDYGDGELGAFVRPTLEASDGSRRYRRVISTSGARDDRAVELGERVGTFSDWDVRVTQEWLEGQLRVWNPELGRWARWDQSAGAYTREVGGTAGVDLPLDPEPVELFSVIVAASRVVPDANLVYDPVGPYRSGLLHRFDPTVPEDVTAAAALAGYCPEGGCDYSVRVTQGGETTVSLLRLADAEGALSATDDEAVGHAAINLPVSDGALERVELLATPDAQEVGAPASPTVLFAWTAG